MPTLARDRTRVRQLLRASAQLSLPLSEAEVATILLREGRAALGANASSVWRLGDEGLVLIAADGHPPNEVAAIARLPLMPGAAATEAIAARRARWLDSPLPAAYLPLLSDGEVFGVLRVGWREPRRFDDDDRAFLELLAQQCVHGFQRVRLYQAERAARERAEEAAARASFLAQAGALLAGSLDYETTLRSVAALAVPRIADWAAIDMTTSSGMSEQVAVAHVDPDKVELAREARRRWPPNHDAARGVPHVIRTGQCELYPEISDEVLVASARDPEQLRIVRMLGLRSALIVPIRSHDRVLGAITFVSAESGRRYDLDDVAMAEQLGERAGLAIANARLYAAERRTRVRIGQLQQATAAFAAVRTLAEIAEVTIELARDVVVASRILLWRYDPDGDALVLLDARGVDAAQRAAVERLPVDADLPVAEAVRTGRARFFDQEELRELGVASLLAGAAIPLIVQGRRVGALGIGFAEPHGFAPDEQDFLRAIADQCAQAIDRVRAYDEVVRAVAVRDDFLSIAGHELKTPLTAILLQFHVLHAMANEPNAPPKLRERVTRLEAQSKRLARLVDELLDVSRVARGQLELDREEVELSQLVLDCVGRFDEQLRRAGSPLELAIEPGVRGRWDRLRVEQVVSNLVTNAIKYGRGRPIYVGVSDRGAMAAVVVQDHGIGIDPDAQHRIFERFERAVSSRHYGGLGLGLWISRQIVEAHGGTITVQSEPGAGARFELQLPRQSG